MIYITGDKHRHFDEIFTFCYLKHTTKQDILIILGDAGINYYLNQKDNESSKRVLDKLKFKYIGTRNEDNNIFLEYELKKDL